MCVNLEAESLFKGKNLRDYCCSVNTAAKFLKLCAAVLNWQCCYLHSQLRTWLNLVLVTQIQSNKADEPTELERAW